MAVQKSRKSRSKRNMHRSHHYLSTDCLNVDPHTGATHRRHHLTPDGYYKGQQIVHPKITDDGEAEESTE